MESNLRGVEKAFLNPSIPLPPIPPPESRLVESLRLVFLFVCFTKITQLNINTQ